MVAELLSKLTLAGLLLTHDTLSGRGLTGCKQIDSVIQTLGWRSICTRFWGYIEWHTKVLVNYLKLAYIYVINIVLVCVNVTSQRTCFSFYFTSVTETACLLFCLVTKCSEMFFFFLTSSESLSMTILYINIILAWVVCKCQF